MKIEKTVDRGSKEKLYVQIYTILIEKIEKGEWPHGRQIPTEDELCRLYDVSKVTVREAVQELVREGYLYRQQGKGTFVRYTMPPLGIVMRARLTEDIFGGEVKARKQMVKSFVTQVPEGVRNILKTENVVHYMLFKKLIDGEACQEEIFVPLSVLPDVDDKFIHQKSLYDYIEAKGAKKIYKVVQSVEVSELEEDTAEFLQTEKGAPSLVMDRKLLSADGIPIAYIRLTCCRKQKLCMEFERIK